MQAVSRYLYNTLINTSMSMSNVIGPREQFMFAGNPCKGFYFMSGRSPQVKLPTHFTEAHRIRVSLLLMNFICQLQSLMVAIYSYMGMVRVAIGAERDFINSELLVACINKSFETTLEAVQQLARKLNMGLLPPPLQIICFMCLCWCDKFMHCVIRKIYFKNNL